MDNFFQRKAEEERVKKEGRLPPGQALTLKFPVLHYGAVPPFDPQTWDFKVWGEVETPPTPDLGGIRAAAAHQIENGHSLRYPLE
jgi:DMSO/TMAO reductase YedYZ molybdopterin-dependent catalytic subunit